MPAMTETLADRIIEQYEELIRELEVTTPEQWQAITPEEGWTVAATAMHIASGHLVSAAWARAIHAGDPLDTSVVAERDDRNAEDARRYAAASKAEVIGALRANGRTVADLVRGLSDEQLAREISLLGRERTAQQIVEQLMMGHPHMHGRSLRTALGA